MSVRGERVLPVEGGVTVPSHVLLRAVAARLGEDVEDEPVEVLLPGDASRKRPEGERGLARGPHDAKGRMCAIGWAGAREASSWPTAATSRAARSHLLPPRAEPAAEPSQVGIGDLDDAHVRVGLEDLGLDVAEGRAVCELHARARGRLRRGLSGLGDSDGHDVVAHLLWHVRVVEEGVLSKLDALLVPALREVEGVHRAAKRQRHALDHRHAAALKEAPVAVAVAPELGQHHDAAGRLREAEQVTHRLPLRRVHEHVPLRRPLREALVHGLLVLGGGRQPLERHEDALGEVPAHERLGIAIRAPGSGLPDSSTARRRDFMASNRNWRFQSLPAERAYSGGSTAQRAASRARCRLPCG